MEPQTSYEFTSASPRRQLSPASPRIQRSSSSRERKHVAYATTSSANDGTPCTSVYYGSPAEPPMFSSGGERSSAAPTLVRSSASLVSSRSLIRISRRGPAGAVHTQAVSASATTVTSTLLSPLKRLKNYAFPPKENAGTAGADRTKPLTSKDSATSPNSLFWGLVKLFCAIVNFMLRFFRIRQPEAALRQSPEASSPAAARPSQTFTSKDANASPSLASKSSAKISWSRYLRSFLSLTRHASPPRAEGSGSKGALGKGSKVTAKLLSIHSTTLKQALSQAETSTSRGFSDEVPSKQLSPTLSRNSSDLRLQTEYVCSRSPSRKTSQTMPQHQSSRIVQTTVRVETIQASGTIRRYSTACGHVL